MNNADWMNFMRLLGSILRVLEEIRELLEGKDD
jgi:hypothetical protein